MRGHVSDTTLESIDENVLCCCRWAYASSTSFTADRQRQREKRRINGWRQITGTENPRAQACFSSFRCSSIH